MILRECKMGRVREMKQQLLNSDGGLPTEDRTQSQKEMLP